MDSVTTGIASTHFKFTTFYFYSQSFDELIIAVMINVNYKYHSIGLVSLVGLFVQVEVSN